jgi:hypothetical protein
MAAVSPALVSDGASRQPRDVVRERDRGAHLANDDAPRCTLQRMMLQVMYRMLGRCATRTEISGLGAVHSVGRNAGSPYLIISEGVELHMANGDEISLFGFACCTVTLKPH